MQLTSRSHKDLKNQNFGASDIPKSLDYKIQLTVSYIINLIFLKE